MGDSSMDFICIHGSLSMNPSFLSGFLSFLKIPLISRRWHLLWKIKQKERIVSREIILSTNSVTKDSQ
jgi:hypothetical protein